jgi:hypothetical protein
MGPGKELLTALVAVALLGAACSGDEGAPPASPTSALSFGSSSASPSGSLSASSSPLPTLSPFLPSTSVNVAGNLTTGSVSVQATGSVQIQKTLYRLITGVGTAPPGGFALVWGGVGGTSAGIGGQSFTGTRPTSGSLTLTIAAQTAEGFATWVSNTGGCDITIDTALETRFEGSFTCQDLRASSGEVIDLSGSFEASG